MPCAHRGGPVAGAARPAGSLGPRPACPSVRRMSGAAHVPASLDRFWAVIPAGGAGNRLWPLSRAASPKFLHDLTGTGRSLLQGTWDRLEPLVGDRTMV